MATPILSIVQNHNEFDNDRKVSKTIDNLNANRYNLLELANKLHSTLELDTLITLFKLDITPILNLDDVFYAAPEQLKDIDPKGRHLLTYQLELYKQSLGKITLLRRTRFTSKEQVFIEKILVTLLAPLNNTLKYNNALTMASHDPLTGVFNRYAMDIMVSREIDIAQRNDTPLSMIALDIDFFKKVNDTHGHAFGDCVLKHLTECIQQCTRTTDALFRYGGEEFNILLNNTELSGAKELAERIRSTIEKTPCICNDVSINITVSMGISSLQIEDNSTALFKRADSALYQAKDSGRNQVISLD